MEKSDFESSTLEQSGFGSPRIVQRADWLLAARALHRDEESWMSERDRLTARRRSMPWVCLDADYEFDSGLGPVWLSELFSDRSQLILYNFRFDTATGEGCANSSLLCDQLDRALIHLEQLDVRWVAVSNAPIEMIIAYQQRMRWSFPWVSSSGRHHDPGPGALPGSEALRGAQIFEDLGGVSPRAPAEVPDLAVLVRAPDRKVYHSYSGCSRKGRSFDAISAWLDLLPKAGNQDEKSWVRRRDEYDAAELGCRQMEFDK